MMNTEVAALTAKIDAAAVLDADTAPGIEALALEVLASTDEDVGELTRAAASAVVERCRQITAKDA